MKFNIDLKNIKLNKETLAGAKKWLLELDRKALLQIVVMAVAFVVFLTMFFLPVLSKNQELSRENKGLQRRVRAASAKISRIPQMKAQKESYGVRIREIREQFFDLEQTDQLIEIIAMAAKAAGVRISASRPSKSEVKLPPPFRSQYVGVSYDLTIEGGYHNIGAFFNGLEEFPKNFVIYGLQIAQPKAIQNQMLQCNFMLTSFMKKGGPGGFLGPGM